MVGSIRMRSVIAGILALAALVFLILEAARLVDVDFLVYLGAADALMSGQDLYNNFNVGGLPFTYPPFAGAVFIPFDLFPPTAAFAIWTAVSIAALAGIAWLTAMRLPALVGKELTTKTWELALFIFAIGAFSETVIKNIELGQVNLVLVLLIMFDTVTKAHYRGFLTGMAAGFKIVPAIFIVFMLVNRRWGDFGRALLGFLTTLAIGSFFGIGQVWQFFSVELWDTTRVGAADRLSNVSMYGALTRWIPGSDPVVLWAVLAATVAAAGLAIAGFWWNHSRLVAAVVVGITGLLVSPVSWVHHWVWFIPAACAAIALAIRAFRSSDRLVGVCLSIAAAAMVLPELGELRYAGGRLAQDSTLGESVVGSGYSLCGLIALAAFALALRLPRRDADSSFESPDQADKADSNRAVTSSTDPMPST